MLKPLRVVSFLLVIFMLALMAVSCAGEKQDDDTTTPIANGGNNGETAPAESSGKYDVKSDLPENLNFNNTEIRILSRDSDWVRDEIWVADQSGDTIGDAIYTRNMRVEEALKVKIVNTMRAGDNYVVSNEVIKLVTSGTDEFDIIANSCYSTIMYTYQNLFRDLNDLEYLNLDKIYWSQGFNDAASFGSHQYFCTGASALTLFRYMFVTMFNKNTLAANDIESLYEVVERGDWTLDYQQEIAAKLYADDGNGIKDENDTFGFMSSPLAYVDPYWSSCKLPILVKTTDNRYEYAVDINRMTEAVDKIIKLYHGTEGSYIITSSGDAQDQAKIAGHFGQGKTATATLRLATVETEYLRNMNDKYGIIPIPKLNKEQDGYATFVHDQFTAFAVASTVPEDRFEVLGAFLECSAAESYRTVIPEYYEIALKGRFLQDDESARMLDIIYENVYIDAGVLYTKSLNSVHQQLRNIVKSQTNSTASTFKTLGKTIPKALESLMEGLDKLG